jgi:hypothetical protein
VPHQPNLDSLEKSAETCALCRLILWAAGCCLTSEKGIVTTMPPFTLPSGKEVMINQISGCYGRMGTRAFEVGALILESSSPGPDFRPPSYCNPRELFPEDTLKQLRPWLFGTWYRSPQPNKPLQLIGLGVRLGTSPRIEDSLNFENDKVWLLGSFLRIRVDSSKICCVSVIAVVLIDFYGRQLCRQLFDPWRSSARKLRLPDGI